jgi:hypothetical protein
VSEPRDAPADSVKLRSNAPVGSLLQSGFALHQDADRTRGKITLF